jgi:hypothetical protein
MLIRARRAGHRTHHGVRPVIGASPVLVGRTVARKCIESTTSPVHRPLSRRTTSIPQGAPATCRDVCWSAGQWWGSRCSGPAPSRWRRRAGVFGFDRSALIELQSPVHFLLLSRGVTSFA